LLRISVLEQAIAALDRPNRETITNAVDLAVHCEALGYNRFWVSEHHNNQTIVGTAPEILMAAIASKTKTIRVGSAGIMLPHYSAFKVAEQFRVLDSLAPGRIDLGLGRAPGSDGRTAFALNPLANERPAQFPSDVRDLVAWVTGGPLIDKHPFGALEAFPKGDTAPEVWILGSSNYGAQIAAHFGLPYCFAWFFSDGRGAAEAVEIYRRSFQPSNLCQEPYVGLCVWAFAAETEEEAQFHYSSRAKWKIFRERGLFLPIEPPEVALQQEYDGRERERLERDRATAFIGTPSKVMEQLKCLGAEMAIDEMALVAWVYDEDVRRKSFSLIANAADLPKLESGAQASSA
jgi:luciferase family oxidoreductase group 1|tara:strand:+ start:415 stop:1455 length:1041 start_codon:yes stop_codon:yes gene_type:complete